MAVSGSDVYIVGYTYSFGEGGGDTFLAKYDSLGNKLWERTWGGTASDGGYGVAVSGSDVYIAGGTDSFGAGEGDAFLVTYSTLISTTLSCSTSNSEIIEGESITVSGSIIPPVSGKTVTVTYKKPDGSTFNRTVTTGSDGAYSDSYKPTVVGSWIVWASWAGDFRYIGASSSSKSFTVTALIAPTASFTYSPESPNEGQTVSFDASGSTDPDGAITTYQWDFGDGNTRTGETATHTYKDPGVYNITLTVTDDDGLTDIVTISCTVSKGVPWIPIVTGVGGVAIAAALFLLRMRKPKEKVKPSTLRITAEPTELSADGRSTSAITIKLLDEQGEPIQALDDTEVTLTTTQGSINSPVTICEGETTVRSTLRSSLEIGNVTVSAEAKELKRASMSLTFTRAREHMRLIQILFLAANPIDTDQLRLGEEMRSIDQAIRRGDLRDKFNLGQQWAVRVTDLQEYLMRYKPHIVHFSGHGSEASEIILEDNYGRSHPVSVRALSGLFRVLKDNIRCVVLNACYSERQAQAIAQHIECVVGMSKAIGDSAAINFAASFYQALAFGRNVKTAFDLACLQIDMQNLDEQDTPKLLALKRPSEEIVFVQGN